MPAIRIVVLANGTVAFQPDVPDGEPGQPLGVPRGAKVVWNNQTNRAHWPWPIDAHDALLSQADAVAFGFFLANEVLPGRASKPTYDVNPVFAPPRSSPPDTPPPRITYVCRLHPNERGQIEVEDA